jgi:hypothetical protein
MKTVQFVSQLAAIMLLFSACNLPIGSGQQPEETPTPAPIPPPGINTPASVQHDLVPVSLPAERANQAADHDSSETAARRFPPGGDRFSRGTYERPFNANTMDVYFPYLDIVDTRVFEDDTWLYASITMRGMDQDQSLPGQYLMEIDQDRDGRGDWLAGVTNPTSTDWTSEGVRVWQDSNDDVGGNVAYLADDNPPDSDGYELLVYDEGKGNKPDAAFAMRDQEDPQTVLLAIQKALFEGDTRFLVGMWAGNNIDPALFDLNDHFTHEEAGAADPGLEIYYPIKALNELDNSCRMAVGFQPDGSEPGLCPAFIPSQPGGAPPGGCQPPPNGCGHGSNWLGEPDCQCTII